MNFQKLAYQKIIENLYKTPTLPIDIDWIVEDLEETDAFIILAACHHQYKMGSATGALKSFIYLAIGKSRSDSISVQYLFNKFVKNLCLELSKFSHNYDPSIFTLAVI